MPKKSKKGKRRDVEVPIAQTADEFEGMLAGFRATDINPALSTSATGNFNSSSTNSRSTIRTSMTKKVTNPTRPKVTIRESIIIESVLVGNITKIKGWAMQGVKVASGYPLCMAAANNAPLDVLSCLVNDLGADPDQASSGGDRMCPLHMAVLRGHIDVVRYLVQKLGADVNLALHHGATPVYIAADTGNIDILRLLVVELGADVHTAINNGCTAVFIAAQNGHVAVVRCLVKEFGADVDRPNCEGTTPLHIAASRGQLAVVRCLVNDLGADITKVSVDGSSPLHLAAFKGNLGVLSCLVTELGFDVNQGNKDGTTPVFAAAQECHFDMVRFLMTTLGADINKPNLEGRTPLHYACSGGDLKAVKLLVNEFGADIESLCNSMTPLMIASMRRHADVVKWLIKAGADPQSTYRLPISGTFATAADCSRATGASAEQTAYLTAKTHCSSPGCGGAGIKKCTGCKQARYCGAPCQLAHWKTHKAECKRLSAEQTINGRKS